MGDKCGDKYEIVHMYFSPGEKCKNYAVNFSPGDNLRDKQREKRKNVSPFSLMGKRGDNLGYKLRFLEISREINCLFGDKHGDKHKLISYVAFEWNKTAVAVHISSFPRGGKQKSGLSPTLSP